jgi:hypothetical protein
MNATLVKTLAAATLAGVVVTSPALADGWGRAGYYRGWGFAGNSAAIAAAGLAGGLAAGALLAQPAYPAAYPVYDAPACYPADRPVVDAWGNVVAYRRIRVCE